MWPVKGVLPIAWRARAEGRAGVLVPPENAAEVKSQELIKRALEIAATGGHNALMLCPITLQA